MSAPPCRSMRFGNDVTIGSQTAYIISVSVQAKDAADAAANANAVADSYISYIGSTKQSGRRGSGPAAAAGDRWHRVGSAQATRQLYYLCVWQVRYSVRLIGAVIALAVNRSDRRLRARDEIANSIGVPVLASFPVGHPSNPGEWTRLLEDYKPGAMHALQLRKALQQLEMAAEVNFGRESGKWSFTVLSLSSDPGALALGPQLAIFAAAQGISTALSSPSAGRGGHRLAANRLRRAARIVEVAESPAGTRFRRRRRGGREADLEGVEGQGTPRWPWSSGSSTAGTRKCLTRCAPPRRCWESRPARPPPTSWPGSP